MGLMKNLLTGATKSLMNYYVNKKYCEDIFLNSLNLFAQEIIIIVIFVICRSFYRHTHFKSKFV